MDLDEIMEHYLCWTYQHSVENRAMDGEYFYSSDRIPFDLTLKELGVLLMLRFTCGTEYSVRRFDLGKNIHRAQEFLKGMKDKGYITIEYDNHVYVESPPGARNKKYGIGKAITVPFSDYYANKYSIKKEDIESRNKRDAEFEELLKSLR